MPAQFLYVIAASSEGPVKLGISADPPQRLQSLQTGHPERLRLFHSEPVDPERGPLLERLLHRDNRLYQQIGEWFNLTVAKAIGSVQFTIIEYALEADLRRCLHRRF
jgi:hypothetical protein